MKIGLIDVDGHHFPNLALMRISAYHNRATERDCTISVMPRKWCLVLSKSASTLLDLIHGSIP